MEIYKTNKISLSGNRKVDPNTLDISKGCIGAQKRENGCYNACYACKMSKLANKDFSVPVPQILDESLLRKQLKTLKQNWVRIGVSGDPSSDWDTTVKVCQIVRESGRTPVVKTKCWTEPEQIHLKQMAVSNTIFQVSMSALDDEDESKRRSKALASYRDLLPGYSVPMVNSLAFKPGELHTRQATDSELLLKFCGSILEVPIRLFKTNPIWKELDESKYHHHESVISGKEDSQYTAGLVINLTGVYPCNTKCSECENQCMVNVLEKK